MSAFKSNTIGLKYGSESYTYFDLLSFEDDDVELVKLNKKLLNRNNIEKFIGYRKRYRIRFNKLTSSQIDFLYSFIRGTSQQINFNSDGGSASINPITNILTTSYPSLYQSGDVISISGVSGSATIGNYLSSTTISITQNTPAIADPETGDININRTRGVKVIDDELAVDLLGGFIEAPSFILEFEDDLLTSVPTTKPAYRNTGNTNSANYNETNKKGVSVLLTYNYGAGEVGRNFKMSLAESYSIRIEREDFEYVDRNRDRKNLGFYQLFNLEFSAFGTQSQITKQDDIEWIKEYCLAPTKEIYIYGLYDSDNVVCDFDEITYEQVESNTYSKSLGLRFISKNLQTTNPTLEEYWNNLAVDDFNEIIINWENLTG